MVMRGGEDDTDGYEQRELQSRCSLLPTLEIHSPDTCTCAVQISTFECEYYRRELIKP